MGQWKSQRGNQKIPWDKWKQKNNFPKSMGHSKNSSKREVGNNSGIPQETRKISNNLTYPLKELEKEKQSLKLEEVRK